MFGDAFASIAEQEQPGISILGDDLHLYNWLSGEPREQRALSQEGAVCFVPTGNNHFPLLEQYILGSKKGQIRKVSFYVYLTEKESALIFQACINKSWNNRVGLDGRAAYAGAYGWPRKHNIVDVATKQWVKIEIDFIDDLGAVEGDTLSHLAFSGQDESLHYDNVCLIEGQE